MKPLTILIDSRIRMFLDELSSETADAIRTTFTHKNPQYAYAKAMGRQWTEPKVYETWRHEEEEGRAVLSIPRGGMWRLRDLLIGYERRIQDRRTSGKVVKAGFIPPSNMNLRGYQEEMVQAAITKQNCLLRAGTGSGKTSAAIALASRLGLYTLVIVWSTNLFDQWVERIEKELGIPAKDVGIIRGSKTILKPITVAMQQTLAARLPEDLPLEAFGCVICDEVQRFAAKTLFDAVDVWPGRYRVGISADESRKDKKEFLIYDLFGAVAADIKRDDLVAEGSVLEVEIRIVPTRFASKRYENDRNFSNLLEEMQEDNERNETVLRIVREEVAAGQQVFLMAHRRGHCEWFANRLDKSGLLLGGPADVEAFATSKRGLDSGALNVGVGTIQAIAQGLDIPRVGRAITATPMASNRQQCGQARGRVCRTFPGKKDAALYYLWDQYVFGIKHVENLVSWNPKVVVQDGDKWIPGKEFIRLYKSRGADATKLSFDFLEEPGAE